MDAPIGLTLEPNPNIPNGTQVWLRGGEVIDITTDDRARFLSQFGLMRVPDQTATKVMVSPEDYDTALLAIRSRKD